jgi:F420H(2)-dependent quinone reductase
MANPETTIQIGPVRHKVRARVASASERDLFWGEFVAFYPGYDFFQELESR